MLTFYFVQVANSYENALYQQGKLDGFRNMREYGWEKVIEGITTIEEVVSSTEIT